MSEREGKDKVVCFSGAKHGVNSYTWTEAGLKALGWTQLAYPTDEMGEEYALDELESALRAGDVAAVVIEPMNSTTGHTCSPDFASELSTLAH